MSRIGPDNVWFLRYEAPQTELFVISDYFLPFYPPNDLENKNFEKMKDMLVDIILQMYTINENNMYVSWDMEHGRHIFFLIFDHLLPFYPPNNPENQNFEKMKKMPVDIIILHMKKMPGNIIISHKCTINDNYMMYDSWDIKRDRQNVLSFWAIFCPFTSLKAQKIKIQKNEKKNLAISSFYRSVPKIMIICYTILRYGTWQV